VWVREKKRRGKEVYSPGRTKEKWNWKLNI